MNFLESASITVCSRCFVVRFDHEFGIQKADFKVIKNDMKVIYFPTALGRVQIARESIKNILRYWTVDHQILYCKKYLFNWSTARPTLLYLLCFYHLIRNVHKIKHFDNK